MEAYVGKTIEVEANGRVFTFDRVTPRMLVELGSHARATGGIDGKGWLTIEQCMSLAETFEGMRWLAWRAAKPHHPEFAAIERREAFYEAIDDMTLLATIVRRLCDFGGDDDGNPPAATEDHPT